jgi:hypothetical protein
LRWGLPNSETAEHLALLSVITNPVTATSETFHMAMRCGLLHPKPNYRNTQ